MPRPHMPAAFHVVQTLAACLSLALFAPSIPAQSPALARTSAAAATSPSSIDPRTWAEQCAAHEALVISHPDSFLRYRMHTVDDKGDQVRDQIETPQGSVARLILRDGRPLTPEEDEAERGRLTYLLNSPSSFNHHIRNEQSNKKMGIDLLRLMPEAMLWSYTPGQPPAPQPSTSARLVVLDFAPNPRWSAPSITAEPLTGLAGRIWIDPETQQLVRIEGSLIKPVNIGWGMVAHLYPGGTAQVDQAHVSGDRWIMSHVVEQINLRALMVKNIRQKLVYDTSAYQPVPSMTWQQAVKLLLDTPLPTR